jgi:hypothetical protein
MTGGSSFCFVVFVVHVVNLLRESEYCHALAIFVQFYQASPAVGRQHIASCITGHRPLAIFFTGRAVGQQTGLFRCNQYQTNLRFSVLP